MPTVCGIPALKPQWEGAAAQGKQPVGTLSCISRHTLRLQILPNTML